MDRVKVIDALHTNICLYSTRAIKSTATYFRNQLVWCQPLIKITK